MQPQEDIHAQYIEYIYIYICVCVCVCVYILYTIYIVKGRPIGGCYFVYASF